MLTLIVAMLSVCLSWCLLRAILWSDDFHVFLFPIVPTLFSTYSTVLYKVKLRPYVTVDNFVAQFTVCFETIMMTWSFLILLLVLLSYVQIDLISSCYLHGTGTVLSIYLSLNTLRMMLLFCSHRLGRMRAWWCVRLLEDSEHAFLCRVGELPCLRAEVPGQFS